MKRFLWVLLLAGPVLGQVVTPFQIRYQTNDRGAITLIANTLMCAQGTGAYGCNTTVMNGTANNNNYTMRFINADPSAPAWGSGRGGSSSATLSLPAGSQVLFAGLYWGATLAGSGSTPSLPDDDAADSTIYIRPPGSSTYQPVSGTLLGRPSHPQRPYAAFADVTSIVQAAGSGVYWVGGIRAVAAQPIGGSFAGWSLVVVYRDTSQPLRNLTVFDGLANVDSSNPTVNIPVSGFLTPMTGPVNAQVGAVAFEGDRGITGDRLRVNGTDISDAWNPADNFFNSSVSLLGTRFSAKTPDYTNLMAVDADVIAVPAGVIPNGATSATLTFTSSGDGYYPAVATFQVNVYVPDLITTFTKTVQDLNGGDVLPGDILEYTLSFTNTGQDGATNVVLTDPIPAYTQYVPGSLVVVSNALGAPTGPMTDAPGDDIAEYDSANNRVVFRLGTGANATSGGLIPPTQGAEVRFRVQVLPSAAGQTITNTAQISYNSQTLGTSFNQNASVSVSVTVVGYALSLSGLVYHDLQPNGARDGGEDWTSGVTVYVKLLQGSSVLQVATVNPGSGAYSFPNLAPGSYTLILDDNNNPADTTSNPPPGWHYIHPAGGVRSLYLNSDLTGQDFGLFHGSRLSGRVFYDNGEGGGVANDARQQGGERGAGGVVVTATDGTNTRTATTNGNGDYLLWIPYAWGSVTLSHPLRPATGWNDGGTATLVGSWAQATAPTSPGAVVSLGPASALPPLLERNFGVVHPGLFRPDRTGTAPSPGVVEYEHLYRPGTLGTVTLSRTSGGYTYLVRLDPACGGDGRFYPLPYTFAVGASWPREVDGSLASCPLTLRVIVPPGEPGGRVDLLYLEAQLAWAHNPGVGESLYLVDTTLVQAAGGLTLEKAVRNLSQNTSWSVQAEGRPGEILEYRIRYRNPGTEPVFEVYLSDPVPFFAELVQDAYPPGGEVLLLCPSGGQMAVDLGQVGLVGLNLAQHCSLNTAPHPNGGGPAPALLPGEGGEFYYRVRIR